MKCDDLLTTYETGGAWARFRARRHATHCEACAAELVQFERVREELSRPVELNQSHRAVWLHAIRHTTPVRQPSGAPLRWSLVTAAALAVVAGLVFSSFDTRPPATEVAVKKVEELAPAQATQNPDLPELKQLEQSLDELSQELEQLDRQAQLLDARRDLDRLSATYQPLGPTSTSHALAN
jgi:hypothetical protein